mmetsp:Transcript_18434/g.36863  ORF Transcript_18434/g.36863 Transcript_18434/m.36863 type:complete len:418 (+) Transcript_18434:47-1300(+)
MAEPVTTQKIGWAAIKDARRSSRQVGPMTASRLASAGYGSVSQMDSFDEDASPPSAARTLLNVVVGKFFPNILLVFMPFGWASYHYQWGDNYVFWFNFLAMVPLASILGDFTEELALHTNQVVGGLINATFGNAVEVVVAIQGMQAGQIRVVQASMLGSVFSNLLLVLGCCFFFGGLKYKEQSYNATSAISNLSLLTLSSLALVLPTPFAEYYDIENSDVLMVSRIAACFLLAMYVQLLVFQLFTHSYLVEDDDDEEEPTMGFWTALGGLCGVTGLVSLYSDWLVSSIDGFTEESGISKTFVGLIILPVVGNAVEHITAVTVAMKNKMDLSMGVAVGSSAQVSLFVVPFIVIYGWVADIDMTLNFPPFEIMLYILAVVIVTNCVSNGKSNWLEGSLLITTYVMVAVGFWFEKVVSFR